VPCTNEAGKTPSALSREKLRRKKFNDDDEESAGVGKGDRGRRARSREGPPGVRQHCWCSPPTKREKAWGPGREAGSQWDVASVPREGEHVLVDE